MLKKSSDLKSLSQISHDCRIQIIEMIEQAASGHPGGSLSAIDVMVSLFFSHMNWDPQNPTWDERDRFILSKGHGVPALYAVLSQAGAIPKEELKTLRKINSRLQGHPDRHLLPVVEASTGSLGQGLSVALGVALGLKTKKSSARVYCMTGDGELQEGQIWEAALSAPKFKTDNLTVIVDHNHGQIDGKVEEVMDLGPLSEKWKAFNWFVQEIDGHDLAQIDKALTRAKDEKGRPSVIVAQTVKGKGVSFMEHNISWHGSAPSKEEASKAISEIRGKHGR